MKRRSFLKLGAAAVVAGPPAFESVAAVPTTLYNGIELPGVWPPRRALDRRIVIPPYLASPPPVIPIDVGRQLFVDDFLIERTMLDRVTHQPAPSPANPILRPDKDWERLRSYTGPRRLPSTPTAMVFSDGVVWNGREFKMWYMGGYGGGTCLATSREGIHWTKQALDVMPGTNIVMEFNGRDSQTIWLDRHAADPAHRYKMALFNGQPEASGRTALRLLTSADGVHWKEHGETGFTRDRSTVFYNPFRGVWVFSLRDDDDEKGRLGRYRRYIETRDFLPPPAWKKGEPVEWVAADVLDVRHPETNLAPELYNLDCVAYESVLLGLFSIFRGDRGDAQKINDICVGYSRDGFHWARPDRRAFIGLSEDPRAWNHGNVQSAGGCCLIVGDSLYFYVSGRTGNPTDVHRSMCSTGLFTMRRDGFASMVWPPDLGLRRKDQQRRDPLAEREGGWLTTRPIRFQGRHLFVNVNTVMVTDPDVQGELRVEVLDERGAVIPPYDRSHCIPAKGDGTRLPVTWQNAADLGALAGRAVKLRFFLTHGHLYSFWVSRTPRGESGGYVAAGGPGYRTPIDQ